MTRLRDIAVVGAGPAGLAIATLLARTGRRVVIHERFEHAAPVGSGIMLQPTGLAVLDAMGLTQPIQALAQPIDRLFGREARRGRVVLDVRYQALKPSRPALGVHRAALFHTLLQAATEAGAILETGHEMVAADHGRLTDRRGRVSPAFDLVIDASGARSAIARGLDARCRELAYGALWATVPWPGAPFDPHALQQVYRGAAHMVGIMPTGRTPDDPSPLATLFWSLKTADHAAWLTAGLARWKAEAVGLWPDLAPVLDGLAGADRFTLARYGHRTLARPLAPRLAVIGDAAHATSPQLGQGANMGLVDAWVLARTLEDHADLDRALAAYATARRLHVRLYQALSLGFTPFYQADGVFRPWLRDHVLGRLARLPFAPRLLAATVSGRLLGPSIVSPT